MRPTSAVAGLLALAVCGSAAALVAPATTEVDLVSPALLQVAPGGSATLSFTVRNVGDGALASTQVRGYMPTSDEALAGYTFVALGTGCGTPYLDPGTRDFTFPITVAIPDGGSVHCSYRVERAAEARDDLRFALCGSLTAPCDDSVAIGTLPQMRIRVEQPFPVAAGATTALVRLSVENLSDWSIPRRDVSTACEEFAGGQAPPGPFLVRNDFEGACPTGESLSCANLGGQSHFAYGFAFGPFAPGESRSCLLRLDFHEPAAAHLRTPVLFTDFRVIGADGAIGVGSPGDLGGEFLGVTPWPAAGQSPLSIPLGRGGLALLAALLLGSVLLLRPLRAVPRGK